LTKEEAVELLTNKNLEIERVEEIFEDFRDDKDVVGQVAMNLSLKTSVYDREQGKSEAMERILIELSKAEDMGSRWAVAKNPQTPVEVLKVLATDKINLVRALVATNPKTPVEFLEKFFSDEKIVRDGLSGNPSTPQKILKTLSDDRDKMVRLRVAENPSTSDEVLRRLLKDDSPDVVRASEIRLGENS
jgi:hypothetical protein